MFHSQVSLKSNLSQIQAITIFSPHEVSRVNSPVFRHTIFTDFHKSVYDDTAMIGNTKLYTEPCVQNGTGIS